MAFPPEQNCWRIFHDEATATYIVATMDSAAVHAIRARLSTMAATLMRVASHIEASVLPQRPRAPTDTFLLRVLQIIKLFAGRVEDEPFWLLGGSGTHPSGGAAVSRALSILEGSKANPSAETKYICFGRVENEPFGFLGGSRINPSGGGS